MIYEADKRYERVKCAECNDIMRLYYPERTTRKPLCAGCAHPVGARCGGSGGCGGNSHWDDDPSGATGSWDQAVKAYES